MNAVHADGEDGHGDHVANDEDDHAADVNERSVACTELEDAFPDLPYTDHLAVALDAMEQGEAPQDAVLSVGVECVADVEGVGDVADAEDVANVVHFGAVVRIERGLPHDVSVQVAVAMALHLVVGRSKLDLRCVRWLHFDDAAISFFLPPADEVMYPPIYVSECSLFRV